MAGGAAELFTECSSCGQQVSTFVTECPYCGTRLRKRAPRLDRKDGDLEALLGDGPEDPVGDPGDPRDNVVSLRPKGRAKLRRQAPAAQSTKRRRRPSGGRLRTVAAVGEGRPWATLLIVLISLIGLPATIIIGQQDLLLSGGVSGNPVWRYLVAALSYDQGDIWHAFAVLTTFGVFGWLWERRTGGVLGPAIVLGTFLVAGVGGLVASAAIDSGGIQAGASGAATALASAWIVAELRARQRKESIDGDLLGASVLLLVTLATSTIVVAGAPVAAWLGVVLGAGLGLALSAARR